MLKLLVHGGVRYIVIGGVACALNRFVRATEDIDIIVESSPENIDLLLKTLQRWGEGFAGELIIDDFSETPAEKRIPLMSLRSPDLSTRKINRKKVSAALPSKGTRR